MFRLGRSSVRLFYYLSISDGDRCKDYIVSDKKTLVAYSTDERIMKLD